MFCQDHTSRTSVCRMAGFSRISQKVLGKVITIYKYYSQYVCSAQEIYASQELALLLLHRLPCRPPLLLLPLLVAPRSTSWLAVLLVHQSLRSGFHRLLGSDELLRHLLQLHILNPLPSSQLLAHLLKLSSFALRQLQ